MTMRKMKDSGLEWIGEIPITWKIQKISSFYSLRSQKVSDKDFPPLSVTKKGILPQLENVAKTNNGNDRKLVRKGDFVINSRSDRRGSCGISSFDGSVSVINTVLCPFATNEPRYLNWLFHTERFADEFYKWGNGIVDDLWSTRWQEMKKISIPVPPLPEQTAIANFLDSKCTEIDTLTDDIEKQIGTLQEYKKSVITEAVTTGLDPNVKMKDSVHEDIGVIPENWKVVPFNQNFSFSRGLQITKENLIDQGIPCISYGNIHSKHNRFINPLKDPLPFVSEEYIKFNKKSLLNKGDFIFADTSEDLEGSGNFSCVKEQSLLFAGYHTIICRNKNNSLNSNFITYLFDSTHFRKQIQKKVSGIKVFSITQGILKSLKLWAPPLQEQLLISNHLDRKCEEIDSIISTKREQLKILSKYKQSLIYEYITGKKTIPNA